MTRVVRLLQVDFYVLEMCTYCCGLNLKPLPMSIFALTFLSLCDGDQGLFGIGSCFFCPERRNKLLLKKDGKCKAVQPASCAGEKVAVRLRTWDYNASRCIKLKLGHLPSSQIANNKDFRPRPLKLWFCVFLVFSRGFFGFFCFVMEN